MIVDWRKGSIIIIRGADIGVPPGARGLLDLVHLHFFHTERMFLIVKFML